MSRTRSPRSHDVHPKSGPVTGPKEEPPQGETEAELTRRLRTLRDTLTKGLVERDDAVRLALLAALAGEHLLLIGPPGTAKSLVARRLHLAFHNAGYFERLLTRFSVPEELFGPLSIRGLEQDRYERLTESYLPTASIAFLDEIFKANSAILNALLTLLNEREFDNGARRQPTPLVAVIGASNELPSKDELGALYDRFLLRLYVGPVSRAGFPMLLGLRGETEVGLPGAWRLDLVDLKQIREAAERVEVPPGVESLLCALREHCTAEKLRVSDRRWRKVVKLLQVSAWTNGREQVSIWDCWLLQHCLWERYEDREKVYDWYAARVGATPSTLPSKLTAMVAAWEGKLTEHQKATGPEQAKDSEGRLLYMGTDGKPTIARSASFPKKRGKSLLYLAPPNAGTFSGRHLFTLSEPSNDGEGYTRAEIMEMFINNHGSYLRFADLPDHRAYFGKGTRLTETRPLEPLMKTQRVPSSYVRRCLSDISNLGLEVKRYEQSLAAHEETLRSDITDHLWVSDDFIAPAADSISSTRRGVKRMHRRIHALRRGFRGLPTRESAE